MQNRHRQLIILFTLLQVIVLLLFGYTPYPDSDGYWLLARDAIAHDDFYPVASELHELPFLWNLGPVNMTVLSLRLFNSIMPLLVLYTLLKGITAYLIYLITKKLTHERIAIITLLLYLFYPANYGEATSLLSELPFTALALTALWLMLNEKYIIGGALLAFANWFRPMGLVFIIAGILYIIAVRKHIIHRTLSLLAGFIIIIGLIGGSNYLRTGRFMYQAATGWMALMQYSWDHDSNQTADKPMFEHHDPNYISTSYFTDVLQKDSVWRSHFMIWLQHNQQEYVSQMPMKLIKTYISDNTAFCAFLPDKNSSKYMYEPLSMERLKEDFPRLHIVQWLTVFNLLYYYLLLFTAIIGCMILFRHRSSRNINVIVLCAGIVITGTAVLLFFGHGETRFHIPFMPFIIILSATAIHHLIYQRKGHE